MAEYLVDMSAFGAEAIKQTLQPVILENNSPDGRFVSMPWFGDFGLLYYRADLLAAYGFQPPQTFDEMENIALEILAGERAAGRGDLLLGLTFQGKEYEGLTCNLLESAYSRQHSHGRRGNGVECALTQMATLTRSLLAAAAIVLLDGSLVTKVAASSSSALIK
jgi:ABC-type glycerol-3-phosphate transport system substrate-binding protein